MKFEGLIDFNKYTLALAAAGVIFTLDTFVPAATSAMRWTVLVLLAMFLASATLGVLVFSVCTKALHGDAAAKQAAIDRLPGLGTAHATLLVLPLIGIGVLLVPHVLAPPQPPPQTVVTCVPPPVMPPRP